jgi:predicted small lipoprotein YifL
MLKLVKSSKIICGVLFVVTALGLSACGKKGPLELPKSTTTQDGSATSKEQTPEEEAKPEKPNRSFFLDGLLQ